MKVHIVKRRGKKESFDERKLYASVYSACLATQFPIKSCEKIAADVTKKVKKSISRKKEIDSDSIFKEVAKHLKKHDKNIAFMYETHRDIN